MGGVWKFRPLYTVLCFSAVGGGNINELKCKWLLGLLRSTFLCVLFLQNFPCDCFMHTVTERDAYSWIHGSENRAVCGCNKKRTLARVIFTFLKVIFWKRTFFMSSVPVAPCGRAHCCSPWAASAETAQITSRRLSQYPAPAKKTSVTCDLNNSLWSVRGLMVSNSLTALA